MKRALKSLTHIVALYFLFFALPHSKCDTPQASSQPGGEITLRNGDLEVTIAVPDTKKDYYRGPRFEHSSFIETAKIGDLTVFGPWKQSFNSGALDEVTGPAGEFGHHTSLGYETTPPGGLFLKIGVGHLRKPDDSPYAFNRNYELVEAGTWKVEVGPNFVECSHELPALGGWSSLLRKRIELVDKRTIRIVHFLKNTGNHKILTEHYAHNFVVFNGQMVGKGDGMEFPYSFPFEGKLREPAIAQPGKIEFQEAITPNKGYRTVLLPEQMDQLKPFAKIFDDSGASVTLIADYIPRKIVFYAHDRAICAEPFFDIDLSPGQSVTWTNTYVIATASDD